MKNIINLILLLALLSCQPMTDQTKSGKTEKLYLEEITIQQLQTGYKEGKFTITDVVKTYLDRIDAIDKNGRG
jgi:amidase